MSEPKYPQVSVRLVGEDGNAFAILGRVMTAMRHGGVSQGEIEAFKAEVLSGDYDHLLQTVMRWVAVEELDEDEDEYHDPLEDPWTRDPDEGDR